MPDELIQRVISVIAATQHIDAKTIVHDRTFEELKIDSLDGINIVFALENEFNISIPDDAAKSLRSVRDAAEGIEKLLESGSGPAPAAV